MCEGVAFVLIRVGLALLCEFVSVSVVVTRIVSAFMYLIDIVAMADLAVKCFEICSLRLADCTLAGSLRIL
jgi:hypothetical protein